MNQGSAVFGTFIIYQPLGENKAEHASPLLSYFFLFSLYLTLQTLLYQLLLNIYGSIISVPLENLR